jgi:hypothetical protein
VYLLDIGDDRGCNLISDHILARSRLDHYREIVLFRKARAAICADSGSVVGVGVWP